MAVVAVRALVAMLIEYMPTRKLEETGVRLA
jgi:hypothetical protein